MSVPKRLVVGLSGASGMPYALDLLQTLRRMGGLEVHLVMSQGAKRVLAEEAGLGLEAVEALAHVVHKSSDLGASIASGSFRTLGMVIVPCSATTLAKVAYGLADNLLTRAAYVTLKERRPLVLVPREAPLPLPSLEAMVRAAQAGATILPAAPGFYHKPKTIDDLLAFMTQRILDLFGLEYARAPRWGELRELELD
ncbi:UbiX family flavin prenyltransferase [Meiothermus taiwanensis]|jgi:4-hydroxy-3-polyprenylbenzoate decarboxylase|uniref:Flavin prenyltransferase UbiX n=2 Tax=Meiothermus taiwanensis TaxID=172827 RepID=A0A399DZU0_9DEIN|nr:UbiX family flavin prenyltransferase [Meiothermus taiwanensis]AWR85619.1 3-octaprenyl-4-hydroxybenzoate carboxy-lyase [Meiothermus taiwanensis WR-220]KIQ54106.1 3-octaprenyl-4-hydroxybenzoate carboxy-lyase [Meiothermus taiwanensis]KZK16668.1 3-octaprenyl-4-hydroxybenzoate carboxy-lyase [Meiothermus taiwanensis]RIH76918.1 Flavin prenyltransferase UbiX [Meiothermus taiwanensis]